MEKNIELAIIKEQEYVNDVFSMRDGDEHPDILDYLSMAGYYTVADFQRDKDYYTLKSITFRDWELTSDEITYHLSDICEQLANNNECCIFYNIDMNQLSAFVPSNFNKEDVVRELQIQPIYGEYKSNPGKGIIITGNNDLKFALSCPKEKSGFLNIVEERLLEYLKQFYNDVIFTGNDILINNKKIIGFASREINDMHIAMFNMNFHDYIYYIDRLCTYDKVPGYIDSDNISARSVLEEIKTWLHLS